MSQLTSEQSQLEMMIQRQGVDRGVTDERGRGARRSAPRATGRPGPPAARGRGALRGAPRERFFENAARNEAFADRAAPIGYGQTISQPYIVALMTQRLEGAPAHHRPDI